MAWTAPMTAVANTAFTAAQFNTHVRDNLLETAPAKATSGIPSGSILTKSNTNEVTWRFPIFNSIDTSQSTSNSSYTNLSTSGPSVTMVTGARALVYITCSISNDGSNSSFAGVQVTGATSISADDSRALRNFGTGEEYATMVRLYDTLNDGTNTFTMKYRALSGNATFRYRHLIVMPL